MEYQPEENCISINDPSLMNKSLESINNNLSIKIDLSSVLNTLPAREQKVIKLRYGLYDGYSHTLEETGQIFGITRERIRQIEAKALRRLRHPTRARKLMGYLD
jgi:RNA polymerase primary sigma factor